MESLLMIKQIGPQNNSYGIANLTDGAIAGLGESFPAHSPTNREKLIHNRTINPDLMVEGIIGKPAPQYNGGRQSMEQPFHVLNAPKVLQRNMYGYVKNSREGQVKSKVGDT